MNRAELDLVTADTEATEKLIAAKNTYRDKPTPGNKQKLDAAKREISDLRNYWRGIRAYLNPGGTVPAVTVKTKAGN